MRLRQPDWSDHSHAIAFTVRSLHARFIAHVMVNAYWEPLSFEVPPGETPWRCLIDTSLPSPDDIRTLADAPPLERPTYLVGPRSFVLLLQWLHEA